MQDCSQKEVRKARAMSPLFALSNFRSLFSLVEVKGVYQTRCARLLRNIEISQVEIPRQKSSGVKDILTLRHFTLLRNKSSLRVSKDG